LSWCRLISAKFRCVSLAFVVGAVATKPVSGARFLLMLSWNWYSQSVPNSSFLKSRGCASFFSLQLKNCYGQHLPAGR
jgi:hypothetical protein